MEDVKDYQIKELKKRIFISNLKAWVIGVILVAEIVFIGALFLKSEMFGGATATIGSKVAILRYDKPVTEEYSARVMEELDKVRKDKSYRAVLFVMSSPGGSPTASEELSEYLKAYRKDKNVTMYIESIAASGGYYIASAIKPLIANKNAIVGSIGVIMPHYNMGELAKKIGIQEDYLLAGKYKKPISFFEEIDKENREYMLKNLLKPTYENFIKAVAANRGITREEVMKLADGKIYIANSPEIQGKLVDEISSLYQVKAKMRKAFKEPKLRFVTIDTEKRKNPFFPSVKVNLNLKEALETLQRQ